MVRIHPDPPGTGKPGVIREDSRGAIAQLGERLLCKQEVTGSIPVGSTTPGGGRAGGERGISNQFTSSVD